jgi:hypothetical protein
MLKPPQVCNVHPVVKLIHKLSITIKTFPWEKLDYDIFGYISVAF